MSALNVALWLAGVGLLVLAVFRARHPYRRLVELDRLAENARRYDSWRGGRAGGSAGDRGTTGAEVMRALLRRRLLWWAAAAFAGALLIFAGFAIR